MRVQSYGSPFESRQHYCFDLASGKEIAGALFIDRNLLLKTISEKLGQQQADIRVRLEDLGKYEIVTGSGGPIEGIRFFIEDTSNYRSSGYQTHEAYFGQIGDRRIPRATVLRSAFGQLSGHSQSGAAGSTNQFTTR